MKNLLRALPEDIPEEIFTEIVATDRIRIERIISNGHATEPGRWYNQESNEWVLVLSGSGTIEYESGELVELKVGDHLLLPRGVKHRVARTDAPTIWLAVHFS